MKKATFLFIISIIIFGCTGNDDTPQFEELLGCIDPESTNYNPMANTDDGSCSYDKNVTFSFTQNWNGQVVSSADFNKTVYTNEFGNTLTISQLRYLISKISLTKADGTIVNFEEYKLVDLRDSASLSLIPSLQIPTGNYIGVSFTYGFNEKDNTSGSYPDLNAATWNWPAMLGGGYHFMQMEGNYNDPSGEPQAYAYHHGTARLSAGVYEQNYISYTFNKNFSINSDATIEIAMNIAEWYKNPYLWDLNVYNTDLMMNYEAQKNMNKNGSSVFSIEQISE